MEPVSIVALITASIPFLTAVFKKVFKTDQLEESPRKGINALIPVVLGILSSGLFAYSQGQDWITALAVGLGSGGAAASARDIDKSLTGIANAVAMLVRNDKRT